MCSCNSNGGAKSGGTQKWAHTYTDSSGSTITKTYSSEMDARMKASSLGGTVKRA